MNKKNKLCQWTQLNDIRVELMRRWTRGEFARLLVRSDQTQFLFPLRLPLQKPDTIAITNQFPAVRTWAAYWSAITAPIRIEWREVQHRVQGMQRLPAQLWIETLDDVLILINKRQEAQCLQILAEQTRSHCPDLLAWLGNNALKALTLFDVWPSLMQVVQWCQQHPRSGIYLRQIDIAGIDSKFIETHRAVLSELLDVALSPQAIAQEYKGLKQFAARYGFLDKPTRIRFRVFNPQLALLTDQSRCPDLTLDSYSFAHLNLSIETVFITENEINFLAFPALAALPHAMVIFGAGYGWQALASAQWLHQCSIYYWGDIDTHGFAILDQLRVFFPQVISLLMDHATLHQHLTHCSQESSPIQHDLARLTPAELALYNDLRDNRIGKHLRLEQERVGFAWLSNVLQKMILDGGSG